MAKAAVQSEKGLKGMSKREKIIGLVAAVAIVLVIIGAAFFFTTRVPSDAAAKVGDQYVSESRVSAFIQEYRTNYGFTDNSAFASYLSYAGLSVAEFRERAINELVIRDLVEERANQLGISVSEDEVDAYYAVIKGDKDTSEGSIWSNVLSSAGLTEAKLKERYRYLILQNKVLEQDVPTRDATDDEVVSYVKENLSGTTQLHVSHIIIRGENAEARANDCYAKLIKARDQGTLTAASFAEAAKTYSDEENVQQTAGEVGWTGSGTIGEDVLAIFEADDEGTIGAGHLLGLISSTTDPGSYEIAYVDSSFTFPEATAVSSISDIGAPESLMKAVKVGANLSIWNSDCSDHLSKMLAEANISYYPMPSDAPYNVK